MTMYEPLDALASPRYSGPRTFARLPHVESTDGVDAAIFGMPWDSGASFRSGARFGPEAVRSASALLRPYNPAQEQQVFGVVSAVDFGDAPTVPGYVEETLRRIEAFAGDIHSGGAVPVGVGGDHSVTLAELRAAARVHGPLGLVHLDAHHDVWDRYFGLPYNHGTFVRRAVEEGLIDPARSIQAGMRGSVYADGDLAESPRLGLELITGEELLALGPADYGDRVRRRVGDGPAFLTFDVDFVDPAFCPGTGTPEVGGPTSGQALAFVRALRGVDFRGMDVVEVAPTYDGPGQVTALVAANVVYEMLTLLALRR
jgi:agmatinase